MLSIGLSADYESGYSSDVDFAKLVNELGTNPKVDVVPETCKSDSSPTLFSSPSLQSFFKSFESAASFASEVFERVTSNTNATDQGATRTLSGVLVSSVSTSPCVQSGPGDDGLWLSANENCLVSSTCATSTVKRSRLDSMASLTPNFPQLQAAMSDNSAVRKTHDKRDPSEFDAMQDESALASLSSSPMYNDTVRLLNELGLSEDHFSQPEAASLGLSSAEELEIAVANCKWRIMKLDREIAAVQADPGADNNAACPLLDTRENLVRMLVALRLRLHELNNGVTGADDSDVPAAPGADASKYQTVFGHQFAETSISEALALLTGLQNDSGKQGKVTSTQLRCDCCAKPIWTVVQNWHVCSLCGYRAHARCLNLVNRRCVAKRVDTLLSTEANAPAIELAICPERGLVPQKFRCAECFASLVKDAPALQRVLPITVSVETRPLDDMQTRSLLIGLSAALRPAEEIGESQSTLNCNVQQCDYSGMYYCATCHWNEAAIIPARVVRNWDFQPRPVCRASKQFLALVQNKAILDIEQINKRLFTVVPALERVRRLRETILQMKRYFVHCHNALSSRILLLLANRQHFVENTTVFSLQDLIDVQNGKLESELREVCDRFAQHIRLDCTLCQAKAFICEICGNDADPLFLFDDTEMKISACATCSTVYHKSCYEQAAKKCRKCARVQMRKKTLDP